MVPNLIQGVWPPKLLQQLLMGCPASPPRIPGIDLSIRLGRNRHRYGGGHRLARRQIRVAFPVMTSLRV